VDIKFYDNKKHNIMKAIILLFSLLVLGCSKNDTPKGDPNNIPQELIGKWKIIEVYETDGASEPQWRNESTIYKYNIWFKNNGEYIKNEGDSYGIYELENNNLKYILTNTQNSQVVYIENLTTDNLIIDFLNFEPYKHKYIKVSSESE
jgi:hypothetical protein